MKRKARIWDNSYDVNELAVEYARRETWWLFFIIPVYVRETVIDKPK